jgi:TolB-like protein
LGAETVVSAVVPAIDRRYWLAAIALLVVGTALWALLSRQESARNPVITIAGPPSIAVLPFVNMSDDPGNEYFSDGLSEEILTLLARIPDLKVIGRTSSFAFKGKNEDLRVIGQTLGVNTVLEGSVRKSGDRVRITAQLIDVTDGAQIWSQTYDRTMTGIFELQDDVAAAVIDALQIHVSAAPTRGRPTESPEAYALFLKARVALNVDDWQKAEEFLLMAIELDSKFAEAYELLAYSYWGQGGMLITASEGQKLTGEAAAEALAIDADLVFAQALYQSANNESDSFLVSIQAYERAAHEQPSNQAAQTALIYDLQEAGYLREALRFAERYIELDPLSLVANTELVNALNAAGHTSEAVAALEVIDQLDPNGANWSIGNVNLTEKQDDNVIAYFETALTQSGLPNNWVRELVAGARDPATGQAYLDRHIPQIVASMPEEDAYGWQQGFASFYLYFGFLDRYFELIFDLELYASTWSDADFLVWKGTVLRGLGFTAHPRYLEVAAALGIVDVWEQRGPPDFCKKLDGQWVCE